MSGTELASLIRPVTALLLGAAILLTGNGVQVALLPIRADLEGFSPLDLGILGTSYFGGLLAGCLLAPRIAGRVGHIRAFAAFTSVAVVAPLAQAVFISPPVWWGLRALTGVCFAGLFMVIESWLNAVADRSTRGRILSTYTLLNLSVVTVGIQIVGFGDPRGFGLFALIAVLFSMAAVPVVLQVAAAPQPPRQPRLRLLWLFGVSPAAAMGCFVAGIANGAFWAYAPLFAARNGLDAKGTSQFLTAVVLGGAATLWPIGYLSDRLPRRSVIAVVAAAASIAGIGLYLESGGPFYALIALGAAYGGMAYPLHAVCTAHANDLVLPKRAVEVSSGLLMMFSVGAIVGPLLASAAVAFGGHSALFLTSATAHGAIAVVMVLRVLIRPRPKESKPDFVPVLETTPQAFELDPRGERDPGSGQTRDVRTLR
jgi:MFS family permease